MPIEGISEVRRLPRLGIVRLGEKRVADSGKEYPAALDYFNLKDAPGLVSVFGAKPKALEIMLPHEDPAVFFPQWRKAYRTSGLFCSGDGRTANRVRLGLSDGTNSKVTKGQPYDPEGERFLKEQGLKVKVGERFALPCPAEDCPFTLQKSCRPIGQFLFLVPTAPGFGCYQISTTSRNGMVELNSYIDAVRSAAGRISMIPLVLSLVPKKANVEGKAKTIHHLKLEYKGTLASLVLYRDLKYISKDLLPAPADIEAETPEDIVPHGGAALDQHLGDAPKAAAPPVTPSEPDPEDAEYLHGNPSPPEPPAKPAELPLQKAPPPVAKPAPRAPAVAATARPRKPLFD